MAEEPISGSWPGLHRQGRSQFFVTTFREVTGFKVVLGGNCELETLIQALRLISKVLKDESRKMYE